MLGISLHYNSERLKRDVRAQTEVEHEFSPSPITPRPGVSLPLSAASCSPIPGYMTNDNVAPDMFSSPRHLMRCPELPVMPSLATLGAPIRLTQRAKPP